MSDYSSSDLVHILEEMTDDQSVDSDVRDFMTLLCQHIDVKNILTPTELTEYDAMIEAGEIYGGNEFDPAIELFPDGLQETEAEDNIFITEEIEMADSHINTITELQRTVNDEIQHVTSGIQQLEQQEKTAHYSLFAEEQQCIKLLSRVSSVQETLLKWLHCLGKLPSEFKDVKSSPWLISQLPLETYRKKCYQFDHYVKMMMKQYLELNENLEDEYEADHVEKLEHCCTELKLEYVYMLAEDQGKKAAIEMLQDIMSNIQTSKFGVSINEIRTQSLLLEEKVNANKAEVFFILDNEVLPFVEEAVKMDVVQIRKCKNEHQLCKIERILKQNECLAKCIETGLLDSELLLILLICERQKLVDMRALSTLCHQEVREQYAECTSRMERMQQLKENRSTNSSLLENPLVQCLAQLFRDEHSVTTTGNIHEWMLHIKGLNKDITSQEERVFDCLLDKHRSICIQNENAIKTAEKYLSSGLTKRPLLLKQISTCNNIEQILESFQEVLKQIKDKYMGKQVSLLQKPFLKEQRLLWIHFLMDPKKLVALGKHLQELTEKQTRYNMMKCQKLKTRYSSFFPQRMQK